MSLIETCISFALANPNYLFSTGLLLNCVATPLYLWKTQNSKIVLVSLLHFVVLYAAAFITVGTDKSLYKDKWVALPLAKKTRISRNTSLYSFRLKYPFETLHIPLGYHLAVRVTINGERLVRYYTPVNVPNTQGHLELVVKTYKYGVVSKYFDKLKIGQCVEFKGPLGELEYDQDTATELGIIAGGSGITPVLQVLQEIIPSPEDLTHISLIYANETEDDILMKSQLDHMAKEYPHFKVHYVIHKPNGKWGGDVGYVTLEEMKRYLPKQAEDHRLLICGPPKMNEMVLNYAKELGWSNGFHKGNGSDKVFVF
ncbi:hypothetical protein SMKI_13G0450 [Saccharomyces mikatae IFO 1815]|uniref:NADH-cytochrome b5 reductase n=1 Tax=Saccharomyces mikatae IFO 1815 TaxID=226126 RepID=A0AA35IR61_SACMI|nr:uncharacterized protein SMKI_13G0450 [Saccharomyces mikatae IFO 1815]CAI4035397.1 hypothetical protein SMKI_13G0450 [Saccharomyces mikatae IFO 1815]